MKMSQPTKRRFADTNPLNFRYRKIENLKVLQYFDLFLIQIMKEDSKSDESEEDLDDSGPSRPKVHLFLLNYIAILD